jgi:metal-dependent hydrolase (beta-lactamase superfamily II)
MKVVVLVENTSGPGGPEGEHGLSLYIETKKTVVLFDTGQGERYFRTAEFMGADVRQYDPPV